MDVSDCFYFFRSGGGEGGGQVGCFIQKSKEGGGLLGGGRGVEGPGGCLRGIGGGLNIFFGAKIPTKQREKMSPHCLATNLAITLAQIVSLKCLPERLSVFVHILCA